MRLILIVHQSYDLVESPVFSYPLLACTVDEMDKDMLDWTDPEHPHEFYDLTKDAQALIRGSDISEKVVFSQVGHYPPETKKTQWAVNYIRLVKLVLSLKVWPTRSLLILAN